jgi:hypothetical protein
MKKKMIALLAGLMLTLSAGSAFASFGDLDLIRVVYQRDGGTVEVATELGNVASLLATTDNTITAPGLFTTLTGSDLSNFGIVYFAVDQTNKDFWITGSIDTKIGSQKSTPIQSATNAMYNGYNLAGGTGGATQVLSTTTNPNSYVIRANMTTGQGIFANAITVAPDTVEASLADLANGAITQELYFWGSYNTGGFGELAGTITTNTDGSTTINASSTPEVPIPAAAWLLGSGLMGLVGIRRKQRG